MKLFWNMNKTFIRPQTKTTKHWQCSILNAYPPVKKIYIATMNVTRVGPIKYIFRLNGVKIIAQPFRSNYGVQSVFRAFPGNKSKIDCRPERCQQWALNAGYRVKNGDRGRRPLGSCWSQIDGIVDYNGRTVFGRFMAFGKVVNNAGDRPFRIG